MIWSNARVTLADGKTLCPIEDLQIGQWLLNPLTDQPQEITDILKRSPVSPDGTCPVALMPHRICAGSFGAGLPLQDIWLSPAQVILATPQGRPTPFPTVTPMAAGLTGTPELPPKGRYAAIFLDRPGNIILEGMPIFAYNLSSMDAGKSKVHRGPAARAPQAARMATVAAIQT